MACQMNKVVDYILTNKPDWVIAKQLKEILEVRKESGKTVNEESSSIPGSKESIAKLYEGQNIFIKYPKSTKAFSVTIVGTLDFNKSLQGLTNTGKEVSFDIGDIQLDTVIGHKLSTLLNNYYTALKNSDPSNEINLDKTLKVMSTNQQDTLTDKYNPLGNRWPEEFENWVKSKNIPFKEKSLWGASNKTYEEIMNFTPSSILTEELYNKLIAAKTNKERASLLVTAKSRDSDNMTDDEFDKYLESTNAYSKKLTDLGINLNKETDLSDSVINKLFGKASDSISNKDDEFIFNPDQNKAIDEILAFIKHPTSTVHVLKGRGGTGKTTIVNKVLELANIKPSEVFFTTISHKAKQVIEKANKKSKYAYSKYAVTESSLFPKGSSQDSFNNNLIESKAKVIVVDEASMVSSTVLKEIEKSAKAIGAKVLYMGDNVQLPPVDATKGSPSPVFDTNNYPNVSTLTQRMRQKETSPILPVTDVLADYVEGRTDSIKFPGVNTTNSTGSVTYAHSGTNTIDNFVKDFKNAPEDTRYVWYNNSVHPKTVSLVKEIRKKLYGVVADKEQYVPGEQIILNDNYGSLDRGNWVGFNSSEYTISSIKTGVGARIIYKIYEFGRPAYKEYIYNNPVYNLLVKSNIDGSTINLISPVANYEEVLNNIKNDLITKNIKDVNSHIKSLRKELADISYSYVISSHKAQGSTYKTVYTDVENILNAPNSNKIDQAKSLYVATSRPREKLVLINADKYIEKENSKQSNTIINPIKYVEEALKGNLNQKSKDLVSKITDKDVLDKLIENIKCTRGL